LFFDFDPKKFLRVGNGIYSEQQRLTETKGVGAGKRLGILTKYSFRFWAMADVMQMFWRINGPTVYKYCFL